MLKPEEIKKYSELSPWQSVAWIIGDWLVIAGSFALAIVYPHPLIYLASAILIARTQVALAIIMHDGCHWRLAKSKTLNDYMGQFLGAGPILFSLYSYRHNHLKHHKNPLAPDDPDITLIGGYPISKASFARKLLRDISGISYFKFIRYFLYGSHKRRKELQSTEQLAIAKKKDNDPMGLSTVIFSILFTNFLIFGTLWYFGHPWLYLFLWLIPAMTILQVLLRIRGIAEHAGYQPGPDQRYNSRTVVNPLQAFFVAPHGVHYHIEHHLYVAVPFYRLWEVHKLMKERGSLPEKNFYTSYGQVIRELVR